MLFFLSAFEDSHTYLQSGNLLWQSDEHLPNAEWASRLRKHIISNFEIDVPCMVFNKFEWKAILDAHPWKDMANADPSKSIVTLMPEALETLSIDELLPYAKSDDLIYHHPPALYLYLPEGMGKSKLDSKRMEKWSGVNCTGRNWRSMNALMKLSEDNFSV